MYRTERIRRWAAGLLAALFCLYTPMEAAALPDGESRGTITVSLSVHELVTDASRFSTVSFELAEGAQFSDLLEASRQRGYLRKYVFDGKLLTKMVFPDRTSFAAGDYGPESGFYLRLNKKQFLPFSDTLLQDGEHYALIYKVHPEDQMHHISPENTRPHQNTSQGIWDESWEATMDAACDWLYTNRTRGNPKAVIAFGVARRAANPTDVALITQMQDQKYQTLQELVPLLVALTYCGYGYPIVNGENLMLKLGNFTSPENCNSLILCDVLQLYDIPDYELSNDILLSRGSIIHALSERQNKDGGFSQFAGGNSGIKVTAKVVSVLQPYRDIPGINEAVSGGISYLLMPRNRDLLFQNIHEVDCITIAQIITAVCSTGLPLNDVYLTYNGLTYADLLREYMCVSGGFSKKPGGRADEISTIFAIIAMRGLKTGKNPYRQKIKLLTLRAETKPAVQQAELTLKQEDKHPELPANRNFFLAVGCMLFLIVLEISRYFRYIRRHGTDDKKEQ